MATKIADDYAAIAARLNELEHNCEVGEAYPTDDPLEVPPGMSPPGSAKAVYCLKCLDSGWIHTANHNGQPIFVICPQCGNPHGYFHP